jgi:hypothetical protein
MPAPRLLASQLCSMWAGTKEDAAKLQAKYKDRLQTVTSLGNKEKKVRRYIKESVYLVEIDIEVLCFAVVSKTLFKS